MNEQLVIKAIQEGKTIIAIQALKELGISPAKEKTLSIIEAEWNTLNQEVLRGTIDSEQRQLRQNRIHDKLLTLLSTKDSTSVRSGRKSRVALWLVSTGLAIFCLAYFAWTNTANSNCPEFKEPSTNKILVVPFENVGKEVSKPHLILRNRIEELTIKNQLSTSIQMGAATEGLTLTDAPKVAESCGANVIIWGTYSNASDSLRLILQYLFLEQPDWSKMSDLIVLKDVTAIQTGKKFKSLEDAILSLCGIIALRQDKTEVAEKWLKKVVEKGEVDLELLKLTKNIFQ